MSARLPNIYPTCPLKQAPLRWRAWTFGTEWAALQFIGEFSPKQMQNV